MTDDIFRGRGMRKRILTPVPKKPTFKRVMSLWEAERRCKYYPQMKESYFDPPTGCRTVERNMNGTTKFWEMLCNCDFDETPVETISPQRVIAKMKELAFNWSERETRKINFTTEYKKLMKSMTDYDKRNK